MPNLRPNSAYSSQPDVALISSIYGEPVEQTKRPNTTEDSIEPSVNAIFRPYKDPRLKPAKDPKLCVEDECRAWATNTGRCVGHSRSLGLIENWGREGRKVNEPD